MLYIINTGFPGNKKEKSLLQADREFLKLRKQKENDRASIVNRRLGKSSERPFTNIHNINTWKQKKKNY